MSKKNCRGIWAGNCKEQVDICMGNSITSNNLFQVMTARPPRWRSENDEQDENYDQSSPRAPWAAAMAQETWRKVCPPPAMSPLEQSHLHVLFELEHVENKSISAWEMASPETAHFRGWLPWPPRWTSEHEDEDPEAPVHNLGGAENLISDDGSHFRAHVTQKFL